MGNAMYSTVRGRGMEGGKKGNCKEQQLCYKTLAVWQTDIISDKL